MPIGARVPQKKEKYPSNGAGSAQLDLEFSALICEAKQCRRCLRMEGSERVIGYSSGPTSADLMFIGEAPGRLGADSSAIPFHGDKAGHNFEAFLAGVGISRYEIFVTNAALCNPKDEKGNNATPTDQEISNCSEFLARQIAVVNPKIVVTLGARSLYALNFIEEHGIKLKEGVRKEFPWNARTLIPLYHPGQRALFHRSFANQLADYQFVKEKLSSRGGNRSSGKIGLDALSLVKEILSKCDALSYFALHKIFYLIEFEAYKRFGRRLTSAYMVRQKDGPYFTDLHISKIKSSLDGVRVRTLGGKLVISLDAPSLFREDSVGLSRDEIDAVDFVVRKYSHMADAEIKTATYMTSPMRRILREEKSGGEGWFNRPIVFDELMGA